MQHPNCGHCVVGCLGTCCSVWANQTGRLLLEGMVHHLLQTMRCLLTDACASRVESLQSPGRPEKIVHTGIRHSSCDSTFLWSAWMDRRMRLADSDMRMCMRTCAPCTCMCTGRMRQLVWGMLGPLHAFLCDFVGGVVGEDCTC